jgi:hypothetical protein
MAEAKLPAEKLPALPAGFEHEWSAAMVRPLAGVLGEGRGPRTLPDDREPPSAETPRGDTDPIPLRRRPRGRRP